jgi:hypothetical protein
LADYAGPPGWLAIAEILGWTAICVGAGLTVAALLGRWREGGIRGYASVLLAAGLVAAFTYAPYWLGLDASMPARIIFTTTLQFVGSLAFAGVVLWLTWTLWSDWERT